MISFLLNDELQQISDAKADTTLLNYLRETQHLCGTKEGCASGDCGACTVVVAELNAAVAADNKPLHYRAINSCVSFLSTLQGKQLITVEHLADESGLHPVQQAMVDHHASQCGFCTPGFVMSMFAFYHRDNQGKHPVDREQVDLALSGNLCRCTGYRPIIDATLSACAGEANDQFIALQNKTVESLSKISEAPADVLTGINSLFMPGSRKELAAVIRQYPDARLFAGSTDLALEVTQLLKDIPQLISLSHIPELQGLEVNELGLKVGAALPFSDMEGALLTHFPELEELLWRFASTPIRNQATLGGNVANASPIGDMPPVLLALEAQIHLDNGLARRVIPAKDFFTGYRQTQLATHEWIEAITIPFKPRNSKLRAYKISKRFEDDISAVCAVFMLQIVDGKIVQLTNGFGGVAATPASVADLNNHLFGKCWADKATYALGKAILEKAFHPIDDVRASAAYRQKIIVNLWYRFWLETTHTIETRVINTGEAHA